MKNDGLLMKKHEISLHTPHPFASLRAGPNPLPQGERGQVYLSPLVPLSTFVERGR
jgi:hypothetical protein